jgi:hypothetical protein
MLGITAMVVSQVMVHKDKIDSSAFFLYRKLPSTPLAPPELIPGPPVEITEGAMSVSNLQKLTLECEGHYWLCPIAAFCI